MEEKMIKTYEELREEALLRHILKTTWTAEKECSRGEIYYCYPMHILLDDDIEALKRMLIRLGEGDVIKERRKYAREGNLIRMTFDE